MDAEFHREYLLRLPLPLAQLYSRAYNAKDARSRHDNCYYLFEVLIKLSACPLTACYAQGIRQGGPRIAKLDQLLLQLAFPSLGQWMAILRETARHYGSLPDAASHPLGQMWGQLNRPHRDPSALAALYRRIKNGPDGQPSGDESCTILQLFEALVQYRNGVIGHGAGRFEPLYANDMGPLLFPAVNEILAEGVFSPLGPPGARLAYLTELRAVSEDRFELGMRELTGEQGERIAPLSLEAGEAAGLAANRVAVLWPGRRAPLRLDPLVIFRESEIADEVLLLNVERSGPQVEYLSYTTGRTERTKDTANELAALLSILAGREVTESKLQELAEQTRAATPSVEALAEPAGPVRRQLGDYEILAEIGRGGMGVVYLARQLSLGRLVALKMLPADLTGDEAALARFRREMRALGRCDHRNIVKLFDSDTLPDGQVYYTMEYVSGCDLEQVWSELSRPGLPPESSRLGDTTFARAVISASGRRRKEVESRCAAFSVGEAKPAAGQEPPAVPKLPPLPPLPEADDDSGGYVRKVVALMRDAALALQAVHDQGIVHRDISPPNLMLTPDGTRVVLMDFGLAKGENLSRSLTEKGGFVGKLRYAAPEQLATSLLKVGPQADVRGLGVTLWELLTRHRLFEKAQGALQLAELVRREDVPRLRQVDPSFDADLEAIVARATERNVADRIESAGRVAEYLQLYLEGKPLPIRTPTLREITCRWAREHKAIAATAAIVLGTIIAALVAVSIEWKAERQAKETADEKKQEADLQKQAVLVRERTIRKNAVQSDFLLASEEAERGRPEQALAYLGRALKLDHGHTPCQARMFTLVAERHWHALLWCAELEGDVHSAQFSRDGRWVVISSSDNTARVWEAATGKPVGEPMRHEDTVWAAQFSPDGRWVLTASADKTARVWEAATGKPVGEPMRHGASVQSAQFSPDGRWVVTASYDNTARVWEAATGKPVGEPMRHESEVECAQVSPDGRWVVTASRDHTARVWETATGKPVGKPMRHEDMVCSAQFSPDGRWVVTAARDGTARVWEAATGEPAGDPMWHEAEVESAQFSPDGRWVVTASQDKTARLWEAAAGKPVREPMRHEGRVRSAQFSPDGRWVVTASGDNTARIWEAATAKPVGEPMRHEADVFSAQFSPDGRWVVTASQDKTARVWEAATGKPVGEPMRHEKGVLSAQFSPDGRRVVTVSSDNTARVWEAATGKPVGEPMRHEKGVLSAQFSPDGRWVVTASQDRTARVWEAATGKPVDEPMRHEDMLRSAQFSPDGRWVVTAAEDKTARVWEAATGKPVGEPMRHGDKVVSAQFSPDGRWVVTASSDNTARVWEAATGKPVGEPMRHEAGESIGIEMGVVSAQFSPDGRWVVTAAEDNTARVWEAGTGNPVSEPMRHREWVQSAQFSPDGRWVVTASGDNTARVWEAATGKPVGEPMRHEDTVWSAQFSPDGRWVATASSDLTARVWETATGKPVGEPMRHEDTVWSAQFSPDGRWVVTASQDKTARVWEAATGKPVGEPMRHAWGLNSAQFSPDGRWVVTASQDKTARVWEAATGKPVSEPMRHEKGVLSAQFSPDGRWVVTASDDNSARVWEAATGKPVGEPMRHEKAIWSVQFSPDGRRVVTASQDNTARVWEAATGKPVGEPMRHEKGVWRAQFSPDGQSVVTGSEDNTARVWEAATGKPVSGPMRHEAGKSMGIEAEVVSAQFSPDGRWVVTASANNTARVWEAATGKPVSEPMRHEESLSSAQFSPDGRWVVTASLDKTARVWPFAEYSPSAEVTALIAVGEYCGGFTLDSESGLMRQLSGRELVELRRRLMDMRQDPLYGNLVRWIVDPPDQRPASPLMDKAAGNVRQPAK